MATPSAKAGPEPPRPSPADPPAVPAGPFVVQPAVPATTTLTFLAVGAATVATLYYGRQLLVPLALGVLLSFVLAPIVTRLRRWGLGRVTAIVATVTLALTLVAGVGALLAGQVVDLAENLPAYEQNLRVKIRALRGGDGGRPGLVERTTAVIRDLGAEFAGETEDREAAQTPGPPAADDSPAREPVPVRITEPDRSPLDVLTGVAGPLLGPVGTAGIVFVFVVFILFQREDLRDRVIRLVGAGDLRRTTEALDEAGTRVSRYLLTHLTLNLLYGVPIALGLWLIGVPNALLWGLLATVLRFIPYLGPVISAVFPIALSVAVDPGWTMTLLTVGLIVGLEVTSNNILEPWLYGTTTGLSPFAIVLAAIFWTALWGPVGLLLATPLTVCLVVLGRHVPQLEFLDVLFGSRPPLPPEARIYQRLLARDPTEAAEIADAARAGHDTSGSPDRATEATPEEPVATYDAVLVPALRLADADRRRGALRGAEMDVILEGMEEIVDYLAEMDQAPPPADDARTGDGRVLCVAGRSTLDGAAAVLLADLLRRHGREARVLPCEAIAVRGLARIDPSGVAAAVLVYLSPGSARHAARMARRLSRHLGPGVPLHVAFLAQEGDRDGPDAIFPAAATRVDSLLAVCRGLGVCTPQA